MKRCFRILLTSFRSAERTFLMSTSDTNDVMRSDVIPPQKFSKDIPSYSCKNSNQQAEEIYLETFHEKSHGTSKEENEEKGNPYFQRDSDRGPYKYSYQRTLEELNLMDSFLFEASTEDSEDAKKIAKIIIERVTGHTVRNLTVETQKDLKGIVRNNRGIRMDIYSKETDGDTILRIYDIEPNNYREPELPGRSRFYQSMIDAKLLSSGEKFETLPELMMIWILPYDPFGDDRMIYTVKNIVTENPNLVYNDGVEKLFVYTRGTKGGSPKLKELLRYLEETVPENAVDEELREMQTIVGKVKHRKDVGEHYMTLQEIIDFEKQYSYEDGLEAGREYGLREGMEAGRESGLKEGLTAAIRMLKDLHISEPAACRSLAEQFHLTEEEAAEYMKQFQI